MLIHKNCCRFAAIFKEDGDPYETRTRVAGVKGRSLNRLTNGPYALLRGFVKNGSGNWI